MKHLNSIAMGVVCLMSVVLPVAAQNASLVGTATEAQQSLMANVPITLAARRSGQFAAVAAWIEADLLTVGNYPQHYWQHYWQAMGK